MKVIQAMADKDVFTGNTYSCLLWAADRVASGNHRKVIVTQQRPNEKKKIIWQWKATT